MDWKFGIMLVVSILNLWLMWRQDQKQARYMNPVAVENTIAGLPWYKAHWKRYWPILTMMALMIGTWIPYLAGVGDSQCPLQVQMWGPTGPIGAPLEQIKSLTVVVDATNTSRADRKHYRIAAVAFHYTGVKDADDVELMKSRAYDITSGQITMLVPLTEAFRNELFVAGLHPTNYVVLLVPQEQAMDGFTTLRQARALGVKQVGQGSGPP